MQVQFYGADGFIQAINPDHVVRVYPSRKERRNYDPSFDDSRYEEIPQRVTIVFDDGTKTVVEGEFDEVAEMLLGVLD